MKDRIGEQFRFTVKETYRAAAALIPTAGRSRLSLSVIYNYSWTRVGQ